jgi:hypothetical protein
MVSGRGTVSSFRCVSSILRAVLVVYLWFVRVINAWLASLGWSNG